MVPCFVGHLAKLEVYLTSIALQQFFLFSEAQNSIHFKAAPSSPKLNGLFLRSS